MTDEELQAIRALVSHGVDRWHGDDVEPVVESINALLAEVDALRDENATLRAGAISNGAVASAVDRAMSDLDAENAELREIAWATIERSWYTHSSTLGGTLHQYACCPFCEKEVEGYSRDIPHTADCPVTKARVLLGD